VATDYDGTIAFDGRVNDGTLRALEAVRKSGRKLVLVTGRELDDLAGVFSHFELFDRIVAENGALLYRPETKEERLLVDPPPPEFARELIKRGAERVSVGRVIVATWVPHETTAVETIRELGLELQVIFNKGAVMVLPSGINKATGLTAALLELGLSPHNVIGIGDAENDHAFLNLCECSVATGNALDTLKERVDWLVNEGHGEGASEMVGALLKTDLAELGDRLRHMITAGHRVDGREVKIRPYGTNILIAGASGGGKSTLATGLIERIGELGYQFLIIDPEGDYSEFEGAVVLGDHQRAPSVQEVMDVLKEPNENVVVNLIGIALNERPKFFETLLPRIQELRARTGRPHWTLVDEAHHVLPSSWEAAGLTMAQEMYGMQTSHAGSAM